MAYRYLLIDTSIIIEYFRKQKKNESILYKAIAKYETVSVSSITSFEIYAGVNSANKAFTDQLFNGLNIIDFDLAISKHASLIYQDLKQENKLIEIRDLFIGATAVSKQLPLMTLNNKHFKRIKNLKLKATSSI